ncbi:MAG: hypothetical protein APG08_00383 [Candidatus Methanofastidiosum methylothiophilum]|uniref:Uncharacterized protein n=1 Tax=Candidatus Methanofastidiosum methylothiophilum TaxID=1705564 RepID=A0A150JDB2_9EURY|nr:MAG: hypothetical protein AN188_00235 [Candidatus Methanofastidiosum methylthiophilus]KYC57102.1 MAG: hypothetical protein APG08_00383 [Candidatus Methanofastidiosum methylthiophilus]OQC52520.1 MAG: hypothetical protein BWX56_00237 [Euryarchaeota archaeon ADurb.Bin023]
MDLKNTIVKNLNKNKEKELEILSIFDNAVRTDTLPILQIQNMPLILEPGEVPHWYSPAVLSQEKEFLTGYGIGTNIMGVGVGGGKANKQRKIGKSDGGGLTLTNKRLIFDGGYGAINYSLPDIVSIYETKKNISISNKLINKIHIYEVDHPNIWATYIKMAINKYHQTVNPTQKKYCKNCGAALSQSSAFCTSCGFQL